MIPALKNVLPFLCIIITFAATRSPAQSSDREPSTKFLGITSEAGFVSFREDLLVPLSFSGPGIALGGSYSIRTETTVFDVDMSMRIAYAVNRFSHEALNLSTRFRTSWLTTIMRNTWSGTLWAGAVLPFRINDMYIFSWDDAHMYWVTSYGVGPTIQWRTSYAAESTIALGLDIPVVHLVSRPPTYRFDKQDGMNRFSFWLGHPQRSFTVEPIGSFTAIALQGTLEWRSSDSFASLGLHLRWTRMDGEKPVQDLNTLIVYSYRWGL